MVEKANSNAAKARGIGNHENSRSNAAEVIATPWALPAKPGSATWAVPITRAVMVQITIVSINGSSRETIPSVTGSSVLTAEWAIEAEPIPASLENTARWKPIIMAPSAPPATPSPVNAPLKILMMTCGIVFAFIRITIMANKQ